MTASPLAGRLREALGARPVRDYVPEEQFFLVVAVVIGILSGLSVVCFRIVIEWSRLYLLGSGLNPAAPRVVLVPTLVGLVVAFLVIRLFPRTRGSGVNQTKAALYMYDGHIPFSTVVGKFVTSALSIGGGHSLGPEDPALQIGAGIASAVGRRLRLSRDRLRLIAPIGAAAGLAAAFNTPITALLFVIEEVIGRWSAGILGPVILSAVSSVVVERWFLGDEPLFRVPAYHLGHPGELAAYAALGVIGGAFSLAFVKSLWRLRAKLLAQAEWTRYLQPAAAGLMIGLIGLRFPQVMGAGYEHVDLAMHQRYTWGLLLALAGLKLVTTGASFSTGAPGGLFAPTLFMGAMLGASVGSIESALFPELPVAVGAYALVGMGTLLAGILRAPMTSVFMILEVSGNYSIILPVMISNTIAYLISRTFQPIPIFDLLSRQDGIDLPSMEEQREIAVLRVEDAMRPVAGPVLDGDDSVARAIGRMREAAERYALVRYDYGVWAGVGLDELQAFAADGKGERSLESILPETQVPHVYPDHLLDVALRNIQHWPLLPVVHRADFRRLLGVVSLSDIVNAYRREGRGLGTAGPGPGS